MSKGINKVILIGNLGKDPEMKILPNGGAVVNLSLATSESWKDKQTGEKKDRTEWHRVVFYNKLAEICNQYLKKGSTIYVEGMLRTRKWTDKNGHDNYTTEIHGHEMQMLSSNNLDNKTHSSPAPTNAYDDTPVNFHDDDIPF